jgi:2-succinyl-6-hydroxy-2,4-cyclohexadiene-1-carboxylate synthase
MTHAVADLVALLDRLDVAHSALLGYSMGGRLALHLALGAPQRISSLLLESASPGIEDAEQRAARVESDSALADDLERDGIEAFADRWQATPLFASQSRLPAAVLAAQRVRRIAQSPLGQAQSLRGMGAGRQAYLQTRLPELTMPVLLLAGALDERYATLARDMSTRIADNRVEIIADASHAAHLEQPEAFAASVGRFLAARVPATTPGG